MVQKKKCGPSGCAGQYRTCDRRHGITGFRVNRLDLISVPLCLRKDLQGGQDNALELHNAHSFVYF